MLMWKGMLVSIFACIWSLATALSGIAVSIVRVRGQASILFVFVAFLSGLLAFLATFSIVLYSIINMQSKYLKIFHRLQSNSYILSNHRPPTFNRYPRSAQIPLQNRNYRCPHSMIILGVFVIFVIMGIFGCVKWGMIIIANEYKKMKKKVTISVSDIINKAATPKQSTLGARKQAMLSPTSSILNSKNKNININVNDNFGNTLQEPLIVDQPIRFQELYRKVVKDKAINGSIKLVYDSKKVTPLQTNRVKRGSLASIHNSKPKTNSNCNSINSNALNSVANSAKRSNNPTTPTGSSKPPKQSIIEPSKFVPPNAPIPSHPLPSSCSVPPSLCLHEQLNKLNHQEHEHIRQRNQCFLNQKEIDTVMKNMGYQIHSHKYQQFLTLLEVDIYGGAPKENFITLLELIQQSPQQPKDKHQQHKKWNKQDEDDKIELPKIVDNNLQLKLDQKTKQIISKYFQPFRIQAHFSTTQKQNKQNLSNSITSGSPAQCAQPLSKKQLSFENILKQKTSNMQQDDNSSYSSPKKISNTIISDLIQALALSDTKNKSHANNPSQKPCFQPSKKPIKPYLQQTLQKQQQLLKISQHSISNQIQPDSQDMSTFRKLQPHPQTTVNGIGNVDQYNFSQELSGGDKGQHFCQKEDSNILQLKNRLNQALRKSDWDQFENCDIQTAGVSKVYNKPILSVDVNLGDGVSEKIIVFQGQTAKEVSDRLANKFTISLETKIKFQKMLETHLSTMLWKIDQLSEQMLTDRDPE